MKQHNYSLTVNWTGNNGTGTDGYKNYERSFDVSAHGKVLIKALLTLPLKVTKQNTIRKNYSLLLSVVATCFGIYIYVPMKELL